MHRMETGSFSFVTKELLFMSCKEKIHEEQMNRITNYETAGGRHV